MNLIDKISQLKEKGKKIALAGLVGSLGYLSNGCGPALTGMGVIRGGAEGAAVAAFGQGVTQLEAAERGKSEVKQEVRVYGNGNENVNQQEDYQPIVLNRVSEGVYRGVIPTGRLSNRFFTSNYFKGDLNNNGNSENYEYEGYGKKIFKRDEKVSFTAFIYNKKGSIVNFILFDEKNNRIKDSIEITLESNSCGKTVMPGPFYFEPGKYSAIWKIGNETIGLTSIDITDSN